MSLIGKKVLLGFEVGTGREVWMDLHHTVITGITQLSGKTTSMEGIVARSGARAVVFLTKRGESGFRGQHELKPYFKEQKKAGAIIDWQYVEAILVAVMDEDMRFPRPWIIKVCNGFTPRGKLDTPIPPARSLEEVYQNVKIAKANPSTKGIDDGIWTQLEAYFEIILPQIKKWDFADTLKLEKGFNVFNLIGMADEMQHLVIESVTSYILKHLNNTIVILPEAHKFIPQGKNTPVKATAQRFIREGATNGDFLLIDSQETTSVDKAILKQCSNWIMGYQQEKNEVANVRDNLGKWNITDEQIMTLKIGHFMVSLQQKTAHIYALPADVEPELARKVAMGDAVAFDEIRTILNGRRQLPVETAEVAQPLIQEDVKMPIVRELLTPADADQIRILNDEFKGRMAEIQALNENMLENVKTIATLDKIIVKKDDYIDKLLMDTAAMKAQMLKQFEKMDEYASFFEKLDTLMPRRPLQEYVDHNVGEMQKHVEGVVTEKMVEEMVRKEISKLGKAKVSAAVSGETPIPWVNTWLPKLTNNSQRKILILVANKHPLPLTKTNIAQMIGVVASGGSFNGNLTQLVKWKLLERNGDSYTLPDVPR